MKSKTRKTVVIIQTECKAYREPLYGPMYAELADHGIDLRLIYSDPSEKERKRRDSVDLPPPLGQKRRGVWFFRQRFLLQLCFRDIWHADLVIVEHALKYVMNPLLLLLAYLRLKRVAVWVHGGPFHRPVQDWEYKYRVLFARVAAWRFAYTEGVARRLLELGTDPSRFTVLNNAIDLKNFRAALEAVTPSQLVELRESLKVPADGHVALFCGSIYFTKGLGFLIDACDQIRAADPLFHLILIGSGSDEQRVLEAAKTRPWLHCLGAIHGAGRAPYFRLSQMALMPYLTGLGILDAMAAGLPYIVTGARVTNPEIEYMVNGVTGITTGDSVSAYAEAILRLFADTDRLGAMSEAARDASTHYSIERMAANFSEGIRRCVSS